ncbi:uncharacterized protein C8Q71DRAFT_744544 [Rhodofomes roseus]|uniref:Cytochrome c oxidase-assembly factor COX23, mitochondrial n=1 Tax=Rhodofomes roseus TaxID=34475 RepID=A0ABQ8KNF5_9APHY|nr:uncharacterized protein C8Q71DRAFT_744544 [Rhodofomes roseus]KAH9839861.1 hypothetical protein C8Q71DRAFT_744544 [Rhodofomes roseus]
MARASKDSGKTEQTPLPHPQENAKPDDWMDTFQAPGRVTTKFVDPCKRAAKASMDCLNRNEFDRDQCHDFFRAYRDCKKDWLDQRKADRYAGRE